VGDGSLIESAASVLVVVDTQPGFLDKLDGSGADSLRSRIAWLVRVASMLDVPIIATEEEPERHGPTDPTVAAAFPPGVVAFRKEVFGLADQADITAAVEATGRRTAVLVGLETDVCVAHSALGLVGRGYRVVVIADATGSPGEAHAAGLERMGQGGVTLTTTKGIFYEWTRTVTRAADVVGAIPPPVDLAL
jgi:nicotinamidase-related amidase